MLRVGVIGLGRHGSRYARHLLAPEGAPLGATLVAVARRQHDPGRAFAEEHGLRFHADYRALIADPAVEAVVVVTPPGMTKAICLEAIRARKPLLVEKPLAASLADAQAIVSAAEQAAVPIMTAHTLRFEAVVQALHALRARAGPARYLVLTLRIEPRAALWRDPVDYGGRGVLLEIGIHLLDLVRFLTDEEVSEVRCEVDSARYPESRAWVSLRLRSGLACLVDVSRLAAGRVSRAEWVGEHGQVIADWTHHRLSWVGAGTDRDERLIPAVPTVEATVRAFTGAVNGRTPIPITGRDGLRAVAIAEACYESAARNRTVRLL